jgi:hypothetical protein
MIINANNVYIYDNIPINDIYIYNLHKEVD